MPPWGVVHFVPHGNHGKDKCKGLAGGFPSYLYTFPFLHAVGALVAIIGAH
jgi:hypothetical protein